VMKKFFLYYEVLLESNASADVSCTILHTRGELEVELYPTFSMFLELQFAVGYGLVNTVVCIVFVSEWVTCFQLFQSRSNSRELMSF